MIKTKYKNGLDFSQIARLTVERATGTSLTPLAPLSLVPPKVKKPKRKQNYKK